MTPTQWPTLEQAEAPRLLVLGDLILDRYTWGDAERVSPEAPVLVLDADEREVRPGGAASVASLLRGLDAKVSLAGVLGGDHDGQTLQQILHEAGVECDLVITDPDRVTTSKERFLGRIAGRPPHQILRVDHEVRRPLAPDDSAQLTAAIMERLSEFQAVLVADYAKGCCTPQLLHTVFQVARRAGIPVLVDPGRGRGLSLYRGATLLKPNRREAEALSGLTLSNVEEALQAARILCETGDLEATIITLDRDGMVYATADGDSGQVTTTARNVFDITGAGDMALAALGFAAAREWPLDVAVELANLAAGLEIERLGIEPITRGELQAARNSTAAPASKILSLDELIPAIEQRRRDGRRIVFTNGCFDLLHAGHLQCLEEARALGDLLIVAINSDASVGRLKGPQRPVVFERERAALLAGLACVDYVTVFDDPTPHRLLRGLRPDVLAKGGTTVEIVGREVVECYGGRVVTTSQFPDRSTTELMGRIRQTAGAD